MHRLVASSALALALLIPGFASAENIEVCGQHNISTSKTYLDCFNLKKNEQLQALKKMKKLERLHISNHRRRLLDATGLKYVAEHVSDTLTELVIDNQDKLDSESFSVFATTKWKLKRLIAAKTGIDDAALKHVANVQTLEEINIGKCKGITGSGLVHLAKLPNLSKFRAVGTAIGDDDIKPLAEIKTLKYVDLSRTKVTDEGIEWLQSKLPGATVKN